MTTSEELDHSEEKDAEAKATQQPVQSVQSVQEGQQVSLKTPTEAAKKTSKAAKKTSTLPVKFTESAVDYLRKKCSEDEKRIVLVQKEIAKWDLAVPTEDSIRKKSHYERELEQAQGQLEQTKNELQMSH